MTVFLTILALGAIALAAFSCWNQLREEVEEFTPGRYWLWFAGGIVLPALFWWWVNSGIATVYPPFRPEIIQARSGRDLTAATLKVMTPAVLLIGSFWAGLTFLWFAITLVNRIPASHRSELLEVTVPRAVFLLPLAVGCVWLLGWFGLGMGALILLGPLVYPALPLLHRPASRKNCYSKAIAKMKFGKYSEAEMEVIQELERSEDDFEGWLMLAELYALHFNDLSGAHESILDLCNQESVTLSESAVALHRLADWHLKIGQNPAAAREVLEEICRRAPGSHLDRMARMRIEQIPANREEFLKRNRGRSISLPPAAATGGEEDRSGDLTLNQEESVARAEACSHELCRDPNNADVRERFARILAERLDQPETALEQLDLLLGMEGQPDEKRATWLVRSADLQLRYRKDFETAEKLLLRVIAQYPQCRQAFVAQRELSLLRMRRRFTKTRSDSSQAPSPVPSDPPRMPLS